MNNYCVPYGTVLKLFSPENTTIVHYSSFTKGLLHFATGPLLLLPEDLPKACRKEQDAEGFFQKVFVQNWTEIVA